MSFGDNFLNFFANKCVFMLNNTNITDKGLETFKELPKGLAPHTINLWNCQSITDKGLEYLKGVHTITLWNCKSITDKGLEYLKGVHTINL